MGSEIPGGLHFVNSPGQGGEDVARTKPDEGGSDEEGVPQGDGGETGVMTVDTPMKEGENVGF